MTKAMLPHDYQLMLEAKYSKANIRDYVRNDVYGFEELMVKINMCVVDIQKWIDSDHYPQKAKSLETFNECDLEVMLVDILSLMLTAYPVGVSFELTAVIGLVNRCMPHSNEYERIKRCGEILYFMAESDIINMNPAFTSASNTITVSNIYALGGSTAKYIALSRFTPPMVCPPKIVKSARDSGYLTKQDFQVLKPKHMHDDYINLYSLNKFMQTAFSIDVQTMLITQDVLKTKSSKDDSKVDREDKEKAFEVLQVGTAEVCAHIVRSGNVAFFAAYYCGRGRTYCRGYHVNAHGNSWRKAILNFKESAHVEVDESLRDLF